MAVMTEELKTVVTIISVLVIVGIFGHGLWSIRKNKQQFREHTPTKSREVHFDVVDAKAESHGGASELDDYGVGQPRVVKTATTKKNLDKVSKSTSVGKNAAQQAARQIGKTARQLSAEQSVNVADKSSDSQVCSSDPHQQPILVSNTSSTDGSSIDLSSIDSPSIEPSQTTKNQRLNELAANQHHSEPSSPEQVVQQTSHKPVAKEPSEVLIIHVSMPDNQTISGASLLPLLISMGFKFGEMDIFHRHVDNAGHGQILFSLASMYNPGTFNIDHIEQISTKGLSLFMTLPCQGEALQNFNMMHNAAKKLAEEFGGQLLDGKRSALSAQTVRHYVEKIRESERQLLING